jgi:hypothetical protein
MLKGWQSNEKTHSFIVVGNLALATIDHSR